MAPTDYDVIIIGGGPAGSVLGCYLAMAGRRTLIVERDVHPRDHVGESITPSTNTIFQEIGFLQKMEDAGFVHKRGACWTAPRAPIGRFVAITLAEFPPPDAVQTYTYNIERDAFDALLLRHAADAGVKVVQGATVKEVLFDGARATGVRVEVDEGWERELTARFVVDASGRRCLLGRQLDLIEKDPAFNQYAIYSWFRDLEPQPEGYEGYLFLHFLDLENAWAWEIPMRNGVSSVGVVTTKADFQKSGRSHQEFFDGLIGRNRTLANTMSRARRIRPWWIEGDYTYKVERMTGPGWVMVGDSMRFVDPIFSSGVDIGTYSSKFASEAIHTILDGGDERTELEGYERRVSDGVDAWYRLIDLFYRLQNLFTIYAVRSRFREKVVRILQGNLYQPESLERAREIIALMEDSYQQVMADETNLLRPGALRPEALPA